MYKEVKNDLFNWGQLLNIVSNFIMVIAFIMFVFIALSMSLNSYPFILSTVIEARNSRRYFPISIASYVYCWVLHLLSFGQVLTFFALGYMGRLLKQRRRIDFALKLQKLTYVCMGIFNLCCLLVLIFGQLLLSDVKNHLLYCSKQSPENKEAWNSHCKDYCINPGNSK